METRRLGKVNSALAKSGEGSKGGKIIGHTKSGKPIYDSHGHAAHAGFAKPDHRDAAKMHVHHQELMDKEHAGGVIGGTESTPHKAQYLHHLAQQEAHENSAGPAKKEKYNTVSSLINHPKGAVAGSKAGQAKHAKQSADTASRAAKKD